MSNKNEEPREVDRCLDRRQKRWLPGRLVMRTLALAAIAVGFLVLGAATIFSAIKEAASLPRVIDASVPFYPPILLKAHIDGEVRLRVGTNGTGVSSVEVIDGQPMLARAASDNIKTWKFEGHQPASFETTFRYRILPSTCDKECNCKSAEPPAILLHMPAEVDVSAEQEWICEFIQKTKP